VRRVRNVRRQSSVRPRASKKADSVIGGGDLPDRATSRKRGAAKRARTDKRVAVDLPFFSAALSLSRLALCLFEMAYPKSMTVFLG
jgi:hypothetical protein